MNLKSEFVSIMCGSNVTNSEDTDVMLTAEATYHQILENCFGYDLRDGQSLSAPPASKTG